MIYQKFAYPPKTSESRNIRVPSMYISTYTQNIIFSVTASWKHLRNHFGVQLFVNSENFCCHNWLASC